jgi:hypothetical protein
MRNVEKIGKRLDVDNFNNEIICNLTKSVSSMDKIEKRLEPILGQTAFQNR